MRVSLKNDQRGIGHLLVALIIVVVLGVVGFAVWRVSNNDNSTTNSSVQANCMKVYKDQPLCNFAAANADLSKTPYTVTVSSVNNLQQTTKITIKSDGKGDFSTSSQNGNQTYNTVTVGNTVYVQNGSSWLQYTSNSGSSGGAGVASNVKAKFSQPGTPSDQQIKYKSLGKSQCGQDTCYKYQVMSPTASGTTYLWINTDTNRLVQLTNKSSQGTSTYNISYGPVTITAPSPVVPASSALDPAQQAEQQAANQPY